METNSVAARKKQRNGSYCCVVDCTCLSSKNPTLSFIKIPRKGASEEQDRWRESLINAINRSDARFNPDKAVICSRHFEADCIKYGPSGKCTGLVFGKLPTRWMPSRSIVTIKTSRPQPTVREPPPVPERVFYYSFEDLRKTVGALKQPWVKLQDNSELLQVALPSLNKGWRFVVTFRAETGLHAEVKIDGVEVTQLRANLETKRLDAFLQELEMLNPCMGVVDPMLQKFAGPPTADSKASYFQLIEYERKDGSVIHSSTVQSVHCSKVVPPSSTGNMCSACRKSKRLLLDKKQRQETRVSAEVKLNDPLHSLPTDYLKQALKVQRKEASKWKKKVEEFNRRLEADALELPHHLHSSLNAVDTKGMNELQQLFWREQQKAFSRKERGMRWHPMLIRLAILLHSRSRTAYATLRETGILVLPGESTLREYTGAVQPEEGFQPEVMEELRKAAAQLSENQRFVVLLHDEMTIKADLVFNQRSGSLVGFINKDAWTFDDEMEKLSTHALVFYVVGVNSSLKMSLGYFGTRSAVADQLMTLLWTAIGCAEECGLKVIASTSDKAPSNQRLYDLHQLPNQSEVCYKAFNIFAPDRNVFFLSDPPHLIKTVRNNLESSGGTKLLWKDGLHLLWRHIIDIYNVDLEKTLRMTNLTAEHIQLNPKSRMRVKLAAQVLSQRVGRVLQNYGPQEAQETAKFLLLMDRFFDCLNTRHLFEHEASRKPDLAPYTKVDDPRFNFLAQEFLMYLKQWKDSVDCRPGFTKAQKQKMFLSHQTYRGLVMTVHGFVEATRYLLDHGVAFVLSNRFCQDPLEEHFGRHRGMGRTAENPNLFQFGHQENQLRTQRQLALMVTPKGNVSTNKQQRPSVIISTSPLKKKRKL